MKTPDEIADEIVDNVVLDFGDFDGHGVCPSINEPALAIAIAAAIRAERERVAIDEVGLWEHMVARAERAEAERGTYRSTALGLQLERDQARAAALREAADHFNAKPGRMWPTSWIVENILALIDKQEPTS